MATEPVTHVHHLLHTHDGGKVHSHATHHTHHGDGGHVHAPHHEHDGEAKPPSETEVHAQHHSPDIPGEGSNLADKMYPTMM